MSQQNINYSLHQEDIDPSEALFVKDPFSGRCIIYYYNGEYSRFRTSGLSVMDYLKEWISYNSGEWQLSEADQMQIKEAQSQAETIAELYHQFIPQNLDKQGANLFSLIEKYNIITKKLASLRAKKRNDAIKIEKTIPKANEKKQQYPLELIYKAILNFIGILLDLRKGDPRYSEIENVANETKKAVEKFFSTIITETPEEVRARAINYLDYCGAKTQVNNSNAMQDDICKQLQSFLSIINSSNTASTVLEEPIITALTKLTTPDRLWAMIWTPEFEIEFIKTRNDYYQPNSEEKAKDLEEQLLQVCEQINELLERLEKADISCLNIPLIELRNNVTNLSAPLSSGDKHDFIYAMSFLIPLRLAFLEKLKILASEIINQYTAGRPIELFYSPNDIQKAEKIPNEVNDFLLLVGADDLTSQLTRLLRSSLSANKESDITLKKLPLYPKTPPEIPPKALLGITFLFTELLNNNSIPLDAAYQLLDEATVNYYKLNESDRDRAKERYYSMACEILYIIAKCPPRKPPIRN